MKYKFIACDMDGTLLNSGHAVSKKNIETINRYAAAGGIFTVATGRCFKAAVMCLKEMNITAPVICFHGGLVADIKTGAALYQKPLPAAVSVEILKWLENRGLYTQIYAGNLMTVEKWTQITQWYRDVCGVEATVAGMPLSRVVEGDKRPLHKILSVAEPETAYRVVKEINAQFGRSVNAALSRPDFAEIGSGETDKGAAADYVLGLYGLKRGDMLAIGDGMNDIPLLKAAGLGAVVGNASEDAKAAAAYIGDTNDNDGVAKIIEKFCLD